MILCLDELSHVPNARHEEPGLYVTDRFAYHFGEALLSEPCRDLAQHYLTLERVSALSGVAPARLRFEQ